MKLRPLWLVFHVSLLALYLELLLIRWIGTEVNIFAYLQNTIIVVCLMALGMGCAVSKRGAPAKQVPYWLLLLACCLELPYLRSTFQGISSMLSLLHDFVVWEQAKAIDKTHLIAGLALGTSGTLILLWVVWRCMFPLGSLLGRSMDAEVHPLALYSVNILGSLAGIWLFCLLSYQALSPWVWFAVFACLWLGLLLLVEAKLTFTAFPLLVVTTGLVASSPGDRPNVIETVWSPYQKLQVIPSSAGEYIVQVNNTGYQQIQDNSGSSTPAIHATPAQLGQYDFPGMLKPDAQQALVVGAGTGNDVAGLLRHTSAQVTAVEIDPYILQIGQNYHPERPYQSARVATVVDDARNFFQSTEKRFDLIVFGLLDSHTTPTLTNARLDHFVYTKESLQQAKQLLQPKGVMVVIFDCRWDFIRQRLATTLEAVFGEPPLKLLNPASASGWGGDIFVAGDLGTVERAIASSSVLQSFVAGAKSVEPAPPTPVEVTTDNWPYLYLRQRTIPTLFYLLGAALLLLWISTSRLIDLPPMLQAGTRQESLIFFSLGAGFSLLEMYGLSQGALLFGSTWVVNAAIISGILLMILVANWWMYVKPNFDPRYGAFGAMALSAVLIAYPLGQLLQFPPIVQMAGAGIVVGLPLLFSGCAFAYVFQRSRSRSTALSANLFGALLGGVLQVISYALGLRAQVFLAVCFYGIALAAVWPRASTNDRP